MKKSIPLIQKIFFANVCFSLLVWNVFIATPFDIFIGNTGEFFGLNGTSLFKLCIKYSIYVWVVLNIFLLCLLILFKEYIQKWILLFFFVIAVSSWINATFLVGEYGVFDGRNNLNIDRFSLFSFLQIGSLLILLFVAFFFRKNLKRLMLLCVFILCINVLTNALNIIIFKVGNLISEDKIDFSLNNKSSMAAKEDFFTYSATNPNILMLLLDEYQMEFFENLLDDEIKKQFEGFIWYRNTVSNFPLTLASIPAIFTGEIQQEIFNYKEMKQFYQLSSRKSIARRFEEFGGRATFLADIASRYSEILFSHNGHVKLSLSSDNPIWYMNLLNYSIFRAVPDMIKRKVYNNEKWLLRPSFPKLDSQQRAEAVGRILPSFKHLVQTRPLVKKDYPKTLKYYRTTVTHAPTIFDKNCNYIDVVPNTFENKTEEGRCAIRLVIDIINNLKSASVFDNTMIIVFSDHGSNFTPKAFETYDQHFPYSKASSTLLIKPLGKTDTFKIDNYPAQLSDIPKTIAQAVHLQDDYPGVDLLSDKKVKSRLRIFYFQKNYLGRHSEYEIFGLSDDPKNWRKKE